MGLFDSAGKDAGATAVANLDPVLANAENRLSSILQNLLNRLNHTKITITVEIPPENPPTNEDVTPS